MVNIHACVPDPTARALCELSKTSLKLHAASAPEPPTTPVPLKANPQSVQWSLRLGMVRPRPLRGFISCPSPSRSSCSSRAWQLCWTRQAVPAPGPLHCLVCLPGALFSLTRPGLPSSLPFGLYSDPTFSLASPCNLM